MKKSLSTITELLQTLNILEFKQHDSFHILKFEDHYTQLPNNVLLHSNKYFEISLSTAGKAKVTIDNLTVAPLQSYLTFVSPGQFTNVELLGDSRDGIGYMILFTSDFIDVILSDFNIIQQYPCFNMNSSPFYELNDEQSKRLFVLMEAIYEKFKLKSQNRFEIVRHYLSIILLESKDLFSSEPAPQRFYSRAEEITYKFENLLKITENKHKGLNHYAQILNITPIYLSECTKKATGKSAKKIISQYIIMDARSLLDKSALNIEEISTHLGFESSSHFNSFFKKNNGITPMQYRNIAN